MKRIFLFLSLVCCFYSCTNKKQQSLQTVKLNGFIQGTTYSITYLHPEGIDFHDSIKIQLKDFEHSMSIYDSSSVISHINNNKANIKADSIFIAVFEKAQEISTLTNGAFDMTVAPLVRMWGFHNKQRKPVTQAMIDSVKVFIGYEKVRLEGRKLIKENPNIMLDANAIAKGFSCDLIGQFFETQGVENYMVEIGGEIKTKGKSPRSDRWKVGINKAIDDSTNLVKEIQEVVFLENCAMATSGSYRKFYLRDGKKYSHEIDPHTGHPVEYNLLSVSIIAPEAITADALATACMVLGTEKSIALLNTLEDIEGYFILSDEKGENKTVMTTGFNQYLE